VVAERWTHLITTYSSPGITGERIHYFLAEGLSEASDRGDFEPEHEEADMTVSWVPVSELFQAVREGRVQDGPLTQALMAHRLLRD
jgi:ADP-ribose pyrophosphatase